jgi:nitrous oxide reductase accessory protein NosL
MMKSNGSAVKYPVRLLLLILLLLAGPAATHVSAASGGGKAQGPVAVPDECYCTECGMTINKSSLFASEIILKDGKAVFFCDLGDMMLYYGRNKGAKVSVVYVKDYVSGTWVDGRKAYFLSGAGVRTPMRYGILAFGAKADAEKFKSKSGGGGIYTLDEAISAGIYK